MGILKPPKEMRTGGTQYQLIDPVPVCSHTYAHRIILRDDKLHKDLGDNRFDLEGIGEGSLDMNYYSQNYFGDQKAALNAKPY